METQKMTGTTADLAAENLAKFRELFPGCVNGQGEVDFVALRTALGAQPPEEDRSIYRLTWNGKEAARAAALAPSLGTLRPVREKSVDFDATRNVYIEGDNLEVLKLLRGPYAGRVKMIYIDPPYNTGHDFVYHDNYSQPIESYRRMVGIVGEDGNTLSTNSDTSGRFHTDWLNMIYPRLILARDFLREDGVIFVSIDDTEQANLRKVMDEVFGESNCVAQLVWHSKYTVSNDAKYISGQHEYIMFYAKNISQFAIGRLPRTEEQNADYKTETMIQRALGNLLHSMPKVEPIHHDMN